MCGILGFFATANGPVLRDRMDAALVEIRHRGPDDKGTFFTPSGAGLVGLAQARLAIIDLSSGGHQPVLSSDGRYAMVYNGELYNYKELREELIQLGHAFKTESDTEVLLCAWQHWGQSALPRFDGMFAFVVHDMQEKTLTCVRDAFGIKPFYYLKTDETFAFGSESFALRKLHPQSQNLNLGHALRYLKFGVYDLDQTTFVDGIQHLLPGTSLTLDLTTNRVIDTRHWYTPSVVARTDLSFDQAAEQLRSLFLDSVRFQLRSDVPIGVALSGGVDSSAVVGAVRHLDPKIPINCFGFVADGSVMSEERWMDLVAQYNGVKLHKTRVDQATLIDELDDFITAHGEPVSNLSYFAEFSVYKLAKQHGVKVLLDGHGADEVICGYRGYPEFRLRSLFAQKSPIAAMKFLHAWSRWPGRGGPAKVGRVLIQGLGLDRSANRLRSLLSNDEIGRLLAYGVSAECHGSLQAPLDLDAPKERALAEALRLDLLRKSCPPQLRGADRSAMWRSIENRVPFLSPPLANFALSMPEHYLVSPQGETKHLFKAAMRGILPDAIINRRDKIGYAAETNMRLTLKPKQQTDLRNGLARLRFINPDAALKTMNEGQNGTVSLHGMSWRLFNLARWAERFDIYG